MIIIFTYLIFIKEENSENFLLFGFFISTKKSGGLILK
jgi:hypothetical protein